MPGLKYVAPVGCEHVHDSSSSIRTCKDEICDLGQYRQWNLDDTRESLLTCLGGNTIATILPNESMSVNSKVLLNIFVYCPLVSRQSSNKKQHRVSSVTCRRIAITVHANRRMSHEGPAKHTRQRNQSLHEIPIASTPQ